MQSCHFIEFGDHLGGPFRGGLAAKKQVAGLKINPDSCFHGSNRFFSFWLV